MLPTIVADAGPPRRGGRSTRHQTLSNQPLAVGGRGVAGRSFAAEVLPSLHGGDGLHVSGTGKHRSMGGGRRKYGGAGGGAVGPGAGNYGVGPMGSSGAAAVRLSAMAAAGAGYPSPAPGYGSGRGSAQYTSPYSQRAMRAQGYR